MLIGMSLYELTLSFLLAHSSSSCAKSRVSFKESTWFVSGACSTAYPCVLTLCSALQLMAPSTHQAFGWRLYKRAGIGGNVLLQQYYKTSSVFFSLLKYDLFLGLLLIMLGYFFLSEPDVELGINIGAMVITFFWALLGWHAVMCGAVLLPFALSRLVCVIVLLTTSLIAGRRSAKKCIH